MNQHQQNHRLRTDSSLSHWGGGGGGGMLYRDLVMQVISPFREGFIFAELKHSRKFVNLQKRAVSESASLSITLYKQSVPSLNFAKILHRFFNWRSVIAKGANTLHVKGPIL